MSELATTPATTSHRPMLAMVLVLIASVFSASMALMVKFATASASLGLVVFFRFVLTLMITMPAIYLNSQFPTVGEQLKTRRYPLHFIRDFAGIVSMCCFFYATKHLSLADSVVLFNTSPLFVPLLAYVFFKKRFKLKFGLSLLLGFIGVVIVVHPDGKIFHLPSFIGLAAGLLAGVAILATRAMSRTEPTTRILFYYFLTGTVLSLLFILLSPHASLYEINSTNILYLVLTGVFAFFYTFSFAKGSRYASVRFSSVFLYFSVVIALLFDWIFWNKVPSIASFIGMALIITGACLLTWLYPRQQSAS